MIFSFRNSKQTRVVVCNVFLGGYRCRREQEEDGRWCGKRSPSRLCSNDGKICCYRNALSTIFLLHCFCALLQTFRFSFFFSFFSSFFPCISACLSPSCLIVCAAAICYSQQVRILQYVFFLLVSFAPHPIAEFFCFFFVSFFFFRSSYFSGGVFLLCSRTRHAST